MGIEQFFSSIEQNNITNLQNNFTYKLQKRVDASYLLIDYNSIVHITSSAILVDLNYLLYHIINKSYKRANKFNQLVKIYSLDIDPNAELNYQDLKQIIDIDKLNQIILDKVEAYTLNILNNFVEPKKLQFLFIAIDGVPHKSKMLEQKKRRFMGTIINELKGKIFVKHEKELMTEPNRYIYEKNKFNWGKIYISPGTKFMGMLNKLLNSNEFTKKVQDICPELNEYMFSGTSEFGEGEKKIVDYVNKLKSKTDSIAVYSPDSDMTLLCLILSNRYENIKILRHNQQQNNYDIIDIDLLRKNLYNYITNSFKIKKLDATINETNAISDIVFILTIFGNDFLPKMETFTVRQDFTRIIDKYIELLQDEFKSKKKLNYIIDGKSIDQEMFLKMMKILHTDEEKNLQKMYMVNHYHNYDKLKKVLEADQYNFTDVIMKFLEQLRTFNNQVRKGSVNKQDPKFIKKLMKMTNFQIEDFNHNDPDDFIDKYKQFYKKNNKLPEVRITFRKYSKRIDRLRDKLEKSLDYLDPNLKITKYDEEVFKLDNMLEEYSVKFHSEALDLGYVSVDPKSYVWKTEPIEKGIKRYYYDFFGLNDTSVQNPEMQKVISEYITGLMWVFDYYFSEIPDKKASVWFYKYTHAPLLTQIYQFMKLQKKDYLERVQKELNKYQVPFKDFFKEKEHLIYVSPIQSYPDIIPNEYIKKLKSKEFQEYNINIVEIVDEVWNHNTTDEIDCRGVIYLNKCHVTAIHLDNDIDKSYENDLQFIQLLRK